MPDIKWEVGKKYRTRAGKWAICAAIIGPHPTSGKPAEFPVILHHEHGNTFTHMLSGRRLGWSDDAYDIIGEWVEPRELVRDVLLLEPVDYPGEYMYATGTPGHYPIGHVGDWDGVGCRVVDIQTVTLKHTPEAT